MMISRLLYSPALQQSYNRIRQMPVVGRLVHALVRNILPPKTRLSITVRSGLAAGLFLSLDPRYESEYAAGVHEKLLLRSLESHLQRRDVLYDVGAHVGFISLVAARIVGSEGKVYAFEADSENSKRILEHQGMNSLPQIEVVHAAVWSECTTLWFRRDSDASSRNSGAVSRIAGDETDPGVSVVDAVTLDHFALDHRPPTVVKIDVEGAEEQVLLGAEAVFRVSHPTLICEIHNARAAEGVASWLARQGYGWKWLSEGDGFPRHLVAEVHR
jgi:FkbM family methyltransferase